MVKKCHDSVSKTWDIYLTRGHFFDCEGHLFGMEGHLFDKEGHLFEGKGRLFLEGSQFCYKLLGGRNFDHVYESLKKDFFPVNTEGYEDQQCYPSIRPAPNSKFLRSLPRSCHNKPSLFSVREAEILPFPI